MRTDTSTHTRSLMKGFSWEVLSTILTFALAWLFFGRVNECLIFAGLCFAVKSVLFYSHERMWHQISYGKKLNRGQKEEEEEEEEA